MVREAGMIPAHIAVGIAAGLLFDLDESSLEIASYCRENGGAAALEKYSGITAEDDVQMIKTFYDMFIRKAPFTEFVETLAAMKDTH